MNLKGRIMK